MLAVWAMLMVTMEKVFGFQKYSVDHTNQSNDELHMRKIRVGET